MQKTTNYVTIRGTKEGLILFLDDECSFSELVRELKEKLSSKYSLTPDGPAVEVKVSAGNRYLTDTQIHSLTEIIHNQHKLVVKGFETNLITKEEAIKMKKEAEITTVVKTIRSGQVLEVDGDLLLLGDVNPGGTVIASGNIYILGVLRGIAHAGRNGNDKAVIIASKMDPSQLRIAHIVNRAPDSRDKELHEMEVAYIGSEDNIAIERVQNLSRFRPQLSTLEKL